MQNTSSAGVLTTQDNGMFGIYKDILKNFPEYSKHIFRKNYFSWLFNQMKSWSKFSWGIVLVNLILQLVTIMTTPINLVSFLGFFGANLSVMCVVGISNRSSIQGWFGLISVFFIAATAFMTGAYATFVEQLIVYMIFLDIPSILHPTWSEKVVPRNFKGIKDWTKYILFALVAWGILYLIFGLTNDPMLLTDSLALALSMTGVIAMLNRYSEQYYFWLANNAVAIAVFLQAYLMGHASPALAISYTLFVLNSLYGLVSWRKEASKEKNKTVSNV